MALSYGHGQARRSCSEKRSGTTLARTAATPFGRDALVSCRQGLRWSYTELDERVDRAAAALIAAGLGPADRLDIWSPPGRVD